MSSRRRCAPSADATCALRASQSGLVRPSSVVARPAAGHAPTVAASFPSSSQPLCEALIQQWRRSIDGFPRVVIQNRLVMAESPLAFAEHIDQVARDPALTHVMEPSVREVAELRIVSEVVVPQAAGKRTGDELGALRFAGSDTAEEPDVSLE